MFVQVGYVHAQLRAIGAASVHVAGKGLRLSETKIDILFSILNSSTRKCIEVTNTRRRSLLKIMWMEISSP